MANHGNGLSRLIYGADDLLGFGLNSDGIRIDNSAWEQHRIEFLWICLVPGQIHRDLVCFIVVFEPLDLSCFCRNNQHFSASLLQSFFWF